MAAIFKGIRGVKDFKVIRVIRVFKVVKVVKDPKDFIPRPANKISLYFADKPKIAIFASVYPCVIPDIIKRKFFYFVVFPKSPILKLSKVKFAPAFLRGLYFV